ncbi:type IV pilus biogenesis protein PilM [Paraburkholderia lycopersici]|uniref:Tfp pilus assembly protein, ATPase PilM n=1 Tax=Paraburkholderia lycopersici TaxID=416944 RepID=A0A1G6YBS9_9BURK|nr:pilus assembly protein PilM [Paraburkholderia lycopersici]SDD87055.1 Tfp pilus assembly protein, ATPase PilM [Paraburkholderia lycopersici]
MGFGNPVLLGARRYAAGVDLGARGVSLVVLSQRIVGAGPVRLEWLASAPLAREAMAGAEIVDRAAVVEALRNVFSELPRACAAASLRCALALPASATLVATVPLARLAPAGSVDDSGLHAGLEPFVLAEAERVAGVERGELAVDWNVLPATPHAAETQVTIAATARQHLEARIECAAMAGITLCAVDDEAHAALRAMRHAAAYELPPLEPWVALWVGPEGVHGWYLVDDSVIRQMRFPALEHADLVEALRDLVGADQAGCVQISGELAMLRGVDFSLADIGEALGAPVLPFECGPLADVGWPLAATLVHDPACAVAFGLALRGVGE